MKKLFLLLLFFMPLCGSAQDISGNWFWQAEDGQAQMEISLKAEGEEYIGYHCAVFQNGNRIDCVEEDKPASIGIKKSAKNTFEGIIRSRYAASEGKIKLRFHPETSSLFFEILQVPDGIYYLPKKAILKSSLVKEKGRKNAQNKPEGNKNLDPATLNFLPLEAYRAINVNEVSLLNIRKISGEITALEKLLQITLSVESPDPEAKTFFNENIRLVYGGADCDWELYYLAILDSSIPLEILGKKVKVGDKISVLELGTKLRSLPIDGGYKSAVFTAEYDDSFVAIHFNPRTNEVIKIEYFSPT